MQFNIALTDFAPHTGGTQFILGSHEWLDPVPDAFNIVPTAPGVGVHKDAVQVAFPAGETWAYTYVPACLPLWQAWHLFATCCNISQ